MNEGEGGREGGRKFYKLIKNAQIFKCNKMELHLINIFNYRGVLPFLERKLLIAQAQEKNRSYSGSTTLGGTRHDHIHEGSQVCLRSRPVYSAGCRGIHVKGSALKCGELQESVFSLNEKCRFKIINCNASERQSENHNMEVDKQQPSEANPELSVGKWVWFHGHYCIFTCNFLLNFINFFTCTNYI